MKRFFFFTGCTYTINGWNYVPQQEYISVYGDDTLPLKLSKKEAPYSCKELVYSSEGYTKVCYIEKESIVKLWRGVLLSFLLYLSVLHT